jgi:hypothetical protein
MITAKTNMVENRPLCAQRSICVQAALNARFNVANGFGKPNSADSAPGWAAASGVGAAGTLRNRQSRRVIDATKL